MTSVILSDPLHLSRIVDRLELRRVLASSCARKLNSFYLPLSFSLPFTNQPPKLKLLLLLQLYHLSIGLGDSNRLIYSPQRQLHHGASLDLPPTRLGDLQPGGLVSTQVKQTFSN